MKIIFFTEWHSNTGKGHLSRCISLSEFFINKGFNPIIFVDMDICYNNELNNYSYHLKWLTDINLFKDKCNNSDVIIIDSYIANYNYYYESTKHSTVQLFFDDFCRLKYPKQGIIVNGSIGFSKKKYKDFGFKNLTLAGTKYQLVQKDFSPKKTISKEIKNILITLGYSNISDVINKIILIVKQAFPQVVLHVVSNGLNKKQNHEKQIKYYSSISSLKMSELMKLCDLAICGAGQTIYELLITNTPFVAIKIAENQNYNASGLIKHKIATVINTEDIEIHLLNQLKKVKLTTKQIIDDKAASRITFEIFKRGLKKWFEIKKANKKDMLNVYNLSNSSDVRKNSFNSKEITLKEHKIWFVKTICNKNSFFYIISIANEFAGQVRYNVNENECVVGISIMPKFRGLKLGEKILTESAKVIKKENRNIEKICAYIKRENLASIKIFENAGYKLILSNDPENYNARKYIKTYD